MISPTARGAWQQLEAKLRPFVARRVRAQSDVDDVVQDVFLRMQRSLSSLRDEQRFGPWVYQVARSAIIDHLRASTKHAVVETNEHLEDFIDTHESVTPEQELAAYLEPIVAMLPSPYREALTLVELEGLTQQQAADQLGLSLSGMKSRVQRGRAQLRQLFDECCLIALDPRGNVTACEPRPNGKAPRGCCS